MARASVDEGAVGVGGFPRAGWDRHEWILVPARGIMVQIQRARGGCHGNDLRPRCGWNPTILGQWSVGAAGIERRGRLRVMHGLFVVMDRFSISPTAVTPENTADTEQECQEKHGAHNAAHDRDDRVSMAVV